MIQDSLDTTDDPTRSSAERRALLSLARATALLALGASTRDVGIVPAAPATNNDPQGWTRRRYGGLFVTFWRGSTLRGCIGTLEPVEDLTQVIPKVTRSALSDARFVHDPIKASELPALRIEISLLSEPQKTANPLSMEVGKHGVLVRRGARSGCFLPKVAVERGWTAEQTLRRCCETKAGLPADAWRDPGTEVLLFTAETFSEAVVAGTT